jgi:hypothetical protein
LQNAPQDSGESPLRIAFVNAAADCQRNGCSDAKPIVMCLPEPRIELFSKGALGLHDARSAIFTEAGREMLRKTLFTLTAVVALGAASTAIAMHGGGGGGGGWGGGGGGGGIHGGGGGWGGGPGMSGARPGGMAPMTMNGANAAPMTRGMTAAPMTGGRVQGWGGRTAWSRDRFHDHFHNRFRNRNFFAFSFGLLGSGSELLWLAVG